MKKEKIFVALILLAAFVLRFWHLEGRMAFDADQETIAWIVKGILVDHKMTLVGIPSSVGGFQLAPLYMYLSALFYWLFKMNPFGVGVLWEERFVK